jgi:hypothetical protein
MHEILPRGREISGTIAPPFNSELYCRIGHVDGKRVADRSPRWSLPDPSRRRGGPDPLFIYRVGSASDLGTEPE